MRLVGEFPMVLPTFGRGANPARPFLVDSGGWLSADIKARYDSACRVSPNRRNISFLFYAFPEAKPFHAFA
jgi:hypothetical protein